MVRSHDHEDSSSSDHVSGHGHHRTPRSSRRQKVKFGSSCGIRSLNEYQDMLVERDRRTANASTDEMETSRAWAEAQASDHQNGHFSSEASAGAAALRDGGHSVYKATAGANAEFGLGGAVADAGADAAVYSFADDEAQIDVGKGYVGGGLGIGAGGAKAKVQVGVDLVDMNVKFSERQGVDVNVGLNADTGAEIGVDGVSASVLGLGFSLGRNTGISTPFGGINFKLW